MYTAAEIGISEDEFWDMLPREFYRRVRARNKEIERRQDMFFNGILLNVNTQRGLHAKNAKPITLEELKKKAEQRGKPTKREVAEMWEKIERRRSIRAEA